MIVKILSSGKSFKGLSTYLTHDPDADTEKRIGWTHTLNLANDHVPSAVDEMIWTARNAELLKQEAGVHAGGRATENPVKHLSLNWAPDEQPTREHMVEATEDFLRHMSWHEHQALLVAHEDKEHSHMHVMLNVVHPETGLKLDDSFERRRAQAWALEYEKENGRIYCEQRLKNSEEREDAPTRPAWMAFQENQKKFEQQEKLIRENSRDFSENQENPKNADFNGWKKLKEIQRHEREAFFADGKSAFSELRNSIYREIREDFRERWGDFYAAKRDGADGAALMTMKAELVAEQNAALETQRDEACLELRETRDGLYRELLDDQREISHAFRSRQEAGLFDDALFFKQLEDRYAGKDVRDSFRETANEVTAHGGVDESSADAPNFASRPERNESRMKSGTDVTANISQGLGFGVISFLESIADGFIGAKPDPKPERSEPERTESDPFEVVIDEARKRQHREQEEADREWRQRQRSYGE